MDNREKYDLLAEEETSLPSRMGIIAYDTDFSFAVEDIKRSLAKASDFKLTAFDQEQPEDENCPITCSCEIEYRDELFAIDLFVCKTDHLYLDSFGLANSIDEQSLAIAKKQKHFLETSFYFGINALESFHLQLKIMDAIVPKAALVVDLTSYKMLSSKWVKMTVGSQTPPHPSYLYTIHAIYNDTDDKGNREYWLHTHGLHRCGTVELEMIHITNDVEQMHTLLNITATKFLSDPALEKERFTIGYDGMGINLCWLRWEDALHDFPKNVLGGIADRQGHDENDYNAHAEPAGVIFAVEDGNMMSPEIYTKTLGENPIFYISTEETMRMSALAQERFHLAREVFEKAKSSNKKSVFGKLLGKSSKDTECCLLVKLGLTIDNPFLADARLIVDDLENENEAEKEHIWFEVLAIEGSQIKGKLLNQPYWIAGLNEGDEGVYPIELLTDWEIHTHENTYSPDSIYLLFD